MTKILAAAALLLAAGGCRMCSDCCDYSPTTPGGLPLSSQRSGSVLSGGMPVGDPAAIVIQSVGAPVETTPIETAPEPTLTPMPTP